MPQPSIRALRSELVPRGLSGFVCLSETHEPRFWGAIWIEVLNDAMRPSTKQRRLRAINRIYSYAQDRHGGSDCLDKLLADQEIDALEDILIGFLASLRNQTARDGKNRSATWETSLAFVVDILRHGSNSSEFRAGAIEARLRRLSQLYGQLSPAPVRAPVPIRALPPVVIEDLYEIFNPSSDRNPFRTEAQRWRNLLVFTLLLRMGLRRGEAAILLRNAIEDEDDPSTGEKTYRLTVEGTADDDVDPRREPPGLKTFLAVRQLPVPLELVAIFERYGANYRGRTYHPQLLMSQKRNPISLRALSEIFEIATQALSEPARRALNKQGLSSVSGHDLRHTCAVTRMRLYQEGGIELDRAAEKLRMFFGWTPSSDMPRLYAQAYFETSAAEVWNESFDDFVDALRHCVGREHT